MKENPKFRVVKLTRKNGMEFWTIQKRFRNWLTGKYIWKFYTSDWVHISWTRYPHWAEMFYNEKDALDEMDRLIKYCNNQITNLEVVKESE